MKEIVFSCKAEELSCIVGNLFAEIEPPCGIEKSDRLTICGTSHTGNACRLIVGTQYCLFCGMPEDLEAARNTPCIERRCCNG